MTKYYISGDFYALTDIGKVREANEDFADKRINSYGNILLVVADGMGGVNKGDYASNMLGKHLCSTFVFHNKEFKRPAQATKWLYNTINEANRQLFKKQNEDPNFKGMGTTLTAALLFDKYCVIAQVGDSRLYRINLEGELEQMTVDQTYVNYLSNNRKIQESEIKTHPERHKLTNAIGVRQNANVDFSFFEYKGEKLLLCSDGLYNNVPYNDIQSILRGNESPERKCLQLIAFGNANGGSDNMAVVIWENSNGPIAK